MKKLSIVSICIVTIMTLAMWASDVSAFSTYSSCSQCHGDFRAVPYKSLADGQTWASGLHDTHRNTMLSGDCNTCHYGSSKKPVYINMSNGGSGLPALGCVGCHGRAEDNNGIATIGAGLRQHHYEAGETVCFDCHDDADPGNYTPEGENVPPPYYFTPDSNHPNKPTNSCNQNGKENFAGTAIGLDNDGDGVYDANDADCQTPVACIDNDGDGYGSNGASTCKNGTSVDCNDNDAAINPGAVEVCDGVDNNCDGQIDEGVMNTYYKDNDGDGYGTTSPSVQGCSQPAGYAPNNTDCNDNDAKEHPNQTWYQDADGDGYSSGNMIVQCARPAGYKTASELQATSGDCNDNSSAVKPGVAEVCDGIDNDCNGQVDEGIASAPTSCGVGVCASTGTLSCVGGQMVDSCTAGTPQTEGPFGSATCGDSLDNDCDGTTDAADTSCAQTCVPSAEVCDGIDNDCNGQVDEGIASTPTSCGVGVCASTGTLSCVGGQMVDSCTAGTAQTEGPFGSATCGDSLDNDCDGTTDAADTGCSEPPSVCIDNDGDGYGANGDLSCPNGTAIDCNDNRASINPGAVEVCDGKDNNCDGQIDEGVLKTYYKDADGDGYGDPSISKQSCKRPRRYVKDNTDCDDSHRKIHPNARERCNGKDDNCDGQIDEGVQKTFYMDADGDGYGDPSVSTQSCRAPEGYVKNNTDCSDTNSSLNEGTAGTCSNQSDNIGDEGEDEVEDVE